MSRKIIYVDSITSPTKVEIDNEEVIILAKAVKEQCHDQEVQDGIKKVEDEWGMGFLTDNEKNHQIIDVATSFYGGLSFKPISDL